MSRVFDVSMFHWEFHLLELRMRELWDSVDYFVVTESLYDHRGKPRRLLLSESDQFDWAKEKLVVRVADAPKDAQSTWDYERHHRRESIRAVDQLDPEPSDLLLVCDGDEIVRPGTIGALRGQTGFFCLEMSMYYYFVNLYMGKWYHPSAISHGLIWNPDEIRAGHNRTFVPNAGWHFSYLGSPEQIQHKLQTFAHDEFDLPEITSLDNIRDALATKSDVLRRQEYDFRATPLDASWPKYLLENRAKYNDFITPA